MAEIVKVKSLISPGTLSPPPCNQLTRNIGQAIQAGDFVYLASTNLWMLANGTAANAAARWVGMAMEDRAAGSPMALTVMWGLEVPYCNSLAGAAIGDPLYLSNSVPGGIATVATTGGDVPCAWITDLDSVNGVYTIHVKGRAK